MKPKVHYLLFSPVAAFAFESANRLYSITAGDIVYTMPYVSTLRLARSLNGTAFPTPEQLKEWFENLPEKEKSLITLSTAKGDKNPLGHTMLFRNDAGISTQLLQQG